MLCLHEYTAFLREEHKIRSIVMHGCPATINWSRNFMMTIARNARLLCIIQESKLEYNSIEPTAGIC